MFFKEGNLGPKDFIVRSKNRSVFFYHADAAELYAMYLGGAVYHNNKRISKVYDVPPMILSARMKERLGHGIKKKNPQTRKMASPAGI
jgi:hypothetical protein